MLLSANVFSCFRCRVTVGIGHAVQLSRANGPFVEITLFARTVRQFGAMAPL
jgi:hypothetical protein